MRNIWVSAAAMALAGTASAATVIVNGAGDVAGVSYQRLSGAIAYVNTQGAGPHTINVTVNSLTENKESLILNPTTINGDADNDDISVTIAVDQVALRSTPNVNTGRAGFCVFEVEVDGTVVVNDIIMYPTTQGSTTTVDPFSFFKPATGTGNYTLNNVRVSGGAVSGYLPVDSVTDNYYANGGTPFRWYAYLNNHGIFNITNDGGAGAYNVTLNNCHGGVARSYVVYIANTSGNTIINGGAFGDAAADVIRINGGTNVTLTGSLSNRILVKRSAGIGSAGDYAGINLVSGSVNTIEFVDSVLHTRTATSSGDPFKIQNGTVVNPIRYCRSSLNQGGSLEVTSAFVGTLNVEKCTFDTSGSSTTVIDPIAVAGGTVNFTDCIFTSFALGKINNTGGTVTFTNCAIPTDAAAGESLNASPFNAAPAGNTSPLSVSPAYMTREFVYNDTANWNFLRPSAAAYTTAATGGGNLTGGAGPDVSAVSDWSIY